jgi:hypothetical protein
MSWFANLDGWQIWGFSFGIAFLVAGLVFLSTRQDRERNKQRQRLSKLPPQSKKRNPILAHPNCPLLQKGQCDFLANEAGQEPKTTKTKQSQTGEQKDYRGTE